MDQPVELAGRLRADACTDPGPGNRGRAEFSSVAHHVLGGHMPHLRVSNDFTKFGRRADPSESS